MENENKNTIKITDSQGNERELKVYFAYHSDNFNQDYIIMYDEKDPDNLLACRIDKDNNLSDIVEDEEYDELDEVIESYQDEHDNNLSANR